MIETPTDAAGVAARLTLERDLAAHAATIERVRGIVAQASNCGATLALADSSPGHQVWQGLASRAFSAAAANLTRELAHIEERLIGARQLIDAASYEVGGGV